MDYWIGLAFEGAFYAALMAAVIYYSKEKSNARD